MQQKDIKIVEISGAPYERGRCFGGSGEWRLWR